MEQNKATKLEQKIQALYQTLSNHITLLQMATMPLIREHCKDTLYTSELPQHSIPIAEDIYLTPDATYIKYKKTEIVTGDEVQKEIPKLKLV